MKVDIKEYTESTYKGAKITDIELAPELKTILEFCLEYKISNATMMLPFTIKTAKPGLEYTDTYKAELGQTLDECYWVQEYGCSSKAYIPLTDGDALLNRLQNDQDIDVRKWGQSTGNYH